AGSRFSEFRLRAGDIEVDIKRANGAAEPPVAAASAPESPAAPAAAPAHSPAPVHADLPAGTVVVRSPMVGTFYRAPEPGAPPFVDIGDEVDPDTIVCIIEVMKLMNSIPAAASGVVTQILVAAGEPVEYGQVLMVIEPR